LRLLLDEQQDRAIAKLLRDDGYDVIAIAERREWRELADVDVLAMAIAGRRAVVTEDARDFAILQRRVLDERRTHYGIVLTSSQRFPRRKRGPNPLAAALRKLLDVNRSEASLRDQLIWLS